jgi:hypothetical protein
MTMRAKTDNSSDVGRLFEAVGINPSAYVQFNRRRSASAALTPQVTEAPSSPHALSSVDPVDLMERSLLPSSPSGDRLRAGEDAPALAGLVAWAEGLYRAGQVRRPMQVALVSLESGAGKTTLAVALAGIFVKRGHSALLIDHSAHNAARTLLGVAPERFGSVSLASEHRSQRCLPLLSQYWDGTQCEDFGAWRDLLVSRARVTFLDGLENSIAAAQAAFKGGARIIVPVLPDMMSVVAALRIDDALDGRGSNRVHFLLNKYDETQSFHNEVKMALKAYFGDRLLPIEIPRNPLLREVAGQKELQIDPAYSGSMESLHRIADWLELESLSVTDARESEGVCA